MKKPTILLIIVLIALGVTIFFINQPAEQIACTLEAKQCSDGSYVGRTGPKCEFAPCPDQQISNIHVYSPKSGETITRPLMIIGDARVFENTFNFRVKDGNGIILSDGFSSAFAPDIGQYGPFSVSLDYPQPETGIGSVEVFALSAKDGSEIDLVSVPIIFPQTESQIVQVFFSNEKANFEQQDCSKVYPVSRAIPKTTAVARASLEELLQGPTGSEQFVGYFTSLNFGVVIQSLTIEKGVAKVDFSDALEKGVGGSCRVVAIRAQIEQTLKQFSSIKSVIISINGRTVDILQP